MARFILAATLAAATLVPLPARAATVQVFMSNLRFCNTPVCAANQNITINAGDTVQWVYADPVCVAFTALGCFHTVTRSASPSFNSGPMPGPGGVGANAVFSRTFTTRGTFGYLCSVHGAAMSAAVVVV